MIKTVVDVIGRTQDFEYAKISEEEYLRFERRGITEDELNDCDLKFASGYSDEDIKLLVNDKAVEGFSEFFKEKYSRERKQYKKSLSIVDSEVKEFYLLRDEGWKRINYQIEIPESFQLDKIQISFDHVELNGEIYAIVYQLMYDGKDFVMMDDGDGSYEDVLLIDKDGSETNIELRWSDDEDEEEEED
jgi:hypothetical protein